MKESDALSGDEDDERCSDCTWDGDRVAIQCKTCQRSVDAMLDHLIAAKLAKMPPQGSA